jgi:RNA polymerase subunit RPABC4/transcription elongation factor Spt4
MSDKMNDLSEGDRERMEEEIESATSALGMSTYAHKDGGTILEDQIGICHNCKRLSFCESEFGNVIAFCETFDGRLSGKNRIIKCNQHSTRGAMAVDDMQNIAIIIDTDKAKIKGFISDDPKFRKKPAGF